MLYALKEIKIIQILSSLVDGICIRYLQIFYKLTKYFLRTIVECEKKNCSGNNLNSLKEL